MSFETVRSAIAGACQEAGLNSVGYLTDDLQTPAALVRVDRVQYDLTYARGADQIDGTVTVVVDRTDEVGAQTQLETFIDPASSSMLKTFLEDSGTVGTAGAHYIRVREAGPVQQIQVGALTYLAVDISFEVVV